MSEGLSQLQEIIDNLEVSSTRQVSFTDRYLDFNSTKKEEFSRLVRGKHLVDLGSGVDAWRMANFALEELGVRKYTGVDISVDFHKLALFRYWSHKGKMPDKDKVEFVEDDMLHYLLQEPDNSAVLTVNGIEDEIIDPNIPANKRYLEKLAQEISRVAGKEPVFGCYSKIVFKELEQIGYRRDTIISQDFGVEVFRKD